MSRYAKPCIACGRELQNVEEDCDNQPFAGLAFVSHGHYGCCVFDPMDGHYLEINVCDPCLLAHKERVLEGRDRRPIMENQDGSPLPHVVGWEDVKWALVDWNPERDGPLWKQPCEHCGHDHESFEGVTSAGECCVRCGCLYWTESR